MLATKLCIIGLSAVTTNGSEACNDIPNLWERFFNEDVASKVPNKTSGDIYAVYSDFETDCTGPYTITIGYPVENVDNIPEGLSAKVIEAQNYQTFVAKGDITKCEDNPVYLKWKEIWKMPLERTYITDYELYKEGMDPSNGEVEIHVGVTQ